MMEKNPWIKDLLVAFAGTTLSIILTFGTSSLIDHINRNKDRRLTAMMVLSSIESSVRSLEESDEIMARKDTLAHWMLNMPLSDVAKLPDGVLLPYLVELMVTYTVSTDKTVENIFSSNTDIWKNVGNFQFIDNVGKCYTTLRAIESEWKDQMAGINTECNRILEDRDKYPGRTLSEKLLSDKSVRLQMMAIPDRRAWLKYAVVALREYNRANMALIGISEQEVKEFTDMQSLEGDFAGQEAANQAFLRGEFAIPPLSLDSLCTLQSEMHLVDSLLKK